MKYLLTTFFLLVACKAYSQECEFIFSGEVIDFHDNTPLLEATIIIIEKNNAVITDANGRFVINDLCSGKITLQVSHPECHTKLIEVNIDDSNTYQRITLEHHLEELEEISLTSDVINSKTNSAQEDVINAKILEKYSSGSLGDALKEISGVSSLNTGSHIIKPIIQGLSGSRILIQNNGVRMQDMEWGDEHAPNVDINSFGRITVIKGAAALQYGGDAIGGAVILEPERIPLKDTLYGKTFLTGTTNGRGGSITSELTKGFKSGWFLKAQGSFKRFGDVETSDYILSNTGISEKGVSLNFGKKSFVKGWNAYYSFYNANIAVLAASHIGNVDDLIRAINSGEPLIIRDFTYDINRPNQEVTHHLGKLKYYKRFESLGKWEIQYDYQYNHRFEFDLRVGSDRDKPAIDLKLSTHTVTTSFSFDSSEKIKLNTGLISRYQNNFANPDTGVRRLIPDYDKYEFGGYITGTYQFTSQLVLDAGSRYDFNRIDAKKFYQVSRWEERGYNEDFSDIIIDDLGTQYLTQPVFNYHSISATLGLQYKFDQNKKALFNYALSQRAPNPSELFSDGLHHSAARIELGDLRLKQETSHKLSLSVLQNKSKWGWEVSPYLNIINDYILLEPTGVEFTIRGAFPVWQYRKSNVSIIGIDANTYINWNNQLRSDHSFSIVKGRERDSKTPMINMPAPTFKNKVSYSKESWHDFTFSLESRYVFRQNEFPPNIYVFSPQANEDILLEINTPPDSYHLLNVDTSMTFLLGKTCNMTVGLTVNNLLNENYRDYLNRVRYFADDLGRNFLLKLKFNY